MLLYMEAADAAVIWIVSWPEGVPLILRFALITDSPPARGWPDVSVRLDMDAPEAVPLLGVKVSEKSVITRAPVPDEPDRPVKTPSLKVISIKELSGAAAADTIWGEGADIEVISES
jgi:hypothetical protein